MAKNIKINHIETLFSAVVIRNAEEMIRRTVNGKRNFSNPITR